MASWPRLPELPQPSTPAAIERTFDGYRAALARMTLPELMALAAQQAALLEAEARTTTSGLLLDWSRNQLDSTVQRSPTTELPSRSPTAPAAAPSPSLPPGPPRRRSRSAPHARELAARLAGSTDSRRRSR
jgi:hypothetical protein